MKCPGQDSRYWDEAAVFETECPNCGHGLEFFKDDSTRKCGNCGQRMLNPRMDFGCASYCPYAEQCLGSLPPELAAKKQELLKDRVAVEVKRHLANDFKRIAHVAKVAQYAEQLGKSEPCNPAVVLVAALVHEVGDDGDIGREILTRLGAEAELINEVGALVAQYRQTTGPATDNFKVLHDAVHLAALEERRRASVATTDDDAAAFHTAGGRKLAGELLAAGR